MNFKKLKSYVQLSRPLNVIITLMSIPVACWIAGGTRKEFLSIVLAAISGALVTAGANAINDFFDIEIDRINRPERPLPRGDLSQHDARLLWVITSVIAVGLNCFITLGALIIVIFAVVLLYFYSARLKGTILAGNLVVGLMTGMAFIYGGAVVSHIVRAVIPALFAFLVNLARELVKDIEDLEGDRAMHAKTLPVTYGVKPALMIATGSLIVLIGCTLVVAFFSVYKLVFLYIVLVADILMLETIVLMWRNTGPIRLKRVSSLLKLCMGIGLLSIIAGSL